MFYFWGKKKKKKKGFVLFYHKCVQILKQVVAGDRKRKHKLETPKNKLRNNFYLCRYGGMKSFACNPGAFTGKSQ